MSSEKEKGRFFKLCCWTELVLAVICKTFRDLCSRGSKGTQARASPGRTGVSERVKSTNFELLLTRDILEPSCIEEDWSRIGGHESTLWRIRKALYINERVGRPYIKLRNSRKGVLLLGPAHCGKSTMVLATAKYLHSHLLSLTSHTFANKSCQEQREIAAGVVSLAMKMSPCLVFIDKLEDFLKQENGDSMAQTFNPLKSILLKMLDDLLHSKCADIHVMGTACKKGFVDQDLLSRFQVTISVPLPGREQRERILGKMLEEEPTSSDIELAQLSVLTAGFSAGDLQSLCRTAALYRIRDCVRTSPRSPQSRSPTDMTRPLTLRPITMRDMETALAEMKPQEYENNWDSTRTSRLVNKDVLKN